MADPTLRQYATETEARYLDALQEHGSTRKAASALGCSKGTLDAAIARVRKRAAMQGYSPEHDQTHPAPPGQVIKGVSTLYGPEGEVRAQWTKTQADRQAQLEIAQEAIQALCEDVPRLPARATTGNYNDDLMAVIPLADPHVGSYVWSGDCHEDYNSEKAVQEICGAVDYLVRQGPRSARCAIINCGDWFHADNLQGITEKSGNVLHLDTRMPKVIREGMMAMRQCVQSALKRHEHVDLINISGNHDEILGCALRVAFSLLYENEPRVTVHESPASRQYLRFGRVLLGACHGHQTKDKDLPGIMATERPEDWGATRHRYFFRGHHHHDSRVEYPGCIVEQVRAMAVPDNYAVEHGFLSGRDAKCITMHREHGEVARTTCALGMLDSAA